jgi:hypothetical protein
MKKLLTDQLRCLGNNPKMANNPERVASFTAPFPPINSALRTPHSALEKVRTVAEAAVSLRALRREIMAADGWSLRDLYRTLETPGSNRLRDAHAALDSAVRAAYGMAKDEDPLAFLLRLNLDLAAKETKGKCQSSLLTHLAGGDKP